MVNIIKFLQVNSMFTISNLPITEIQLDTEII
jgi:hypothetical protein